nr:MAG TPA: hypothetical protein [Caudoviricetes sp.]
MPSITAYSITYLVQFNSWKYSLIFTGLIPLRL